MGDAADNIHAPLLHEALAQHFSLDELKLLCVNAGINPDSVPFADRGIDLFAFCMTEAFRQQNNLQSLLQACAKARPDVPWADYTVATTVPAQWIDLFTAKNLINTQGGLVIFGDVNAEKIVGRDEITNVFTEETAYNVAGLRNPYLGLKPFTYGDREKYAGREREIKLAIDALTFAGSERTLLFITGASGSGKSSFAMAGLLPALQAYYLSLGFSVAPPTVMRPSQQPIAQLAIALRRLGLPPEPAFEAIKPFMVGVPSNPPLTNQIGLLVIDQFEELYSQSDTSQRDVFLTILSKLPPLSQLRMHLIATLRADYLPALFNSKHLYDIAKQGIDLRAMTYEELAGAIQRPLQTAHPTKRFEPALVRKLAQDTAEDASSLPLLQVTLEDLFARGQLRLSQYDTISDAIRKRADIVMAFVDHEGARRESRTLEAQDAILQVFIDLIDVSRNDDDIHTYVRQRRKLADMVESAPGREPLIREMTQARLLSMESESAGDDQAPVETVTLTHESLIYHWPALRDAVSRKRQLLQRRIRFKEALQTWQATPADDNLLTHVRLAEARELERANDVDVRGSLERDFIRRSIERAEAEQREREQNLRQIAEENRLRAEAQAKANSRLRALVLVLMVAGAVSIFAVLLGVAAFQQTQTAAASRSRFLAGIAERWRTSDADRAVLIALEAYQTSPTRDALDVLQYAITAPEQHLLKFNQEEERTFEDNSPATAGLRFSPDGKWLIGFGDRIDVWEVATGRHLRSFYDDPAHGLIHDVQFSKDGGRIYVGADNVTVWDVAAGSEVSSAFSTDNTPTGIRISPDGRFLLTFDSALEGEATPEAQEAQLWDTATGSLRANLIGHNGSIKDADFSSTGNLIATGGDDGSVMIWRADATDKPLKKFSLSGAIQKARFSSDGSLLAAADVAGQVTVWRVADWSAHLSYTFNGKVNGLEFSSDNQRLVASSDDGLFVNMDAQTSQKPYRKNLRIAVTGVSFSPNGRYILATLSNGTVQLFHAARENKLIYAFSGHEGGVQQASFSPDGSVVATLDGNGRIRTWNLFHPGALMGHTLRVWSAALSPDEKRLVTTSEDKTASLWDWETGAMQHVLSGSIDQVRYAEFSPDGKLVVTAGFDGQVRLWDADTGRPLTITLAHPAPVQVARFSKDSHYLLTACNDGIARVWRIDAGVVDRQFEGHQGIIYDARFSHDQTRIATAGADGTVRIWDVATGAQKIEPIRYGGEVFAVAFSPDDRQILYAGYDKVAQLWDFGAGRVVRTFAGHEDSIFEVDFSFDGGKLATASQDETVRIWDARTGDLLNIIRGNDDVVNDVSFSRDGTYIVTAGANTIARRIPLRAEEILRLARQQTRGELACWERVRFLGEIADCASPVTASPRN